MKFYTVDLNKKDLYDQFKHSDTYFKWLKLPDYFKTSEFKVYFTMFGLNKFISYDFENMQNNLGYTKDNFDIKAIASEKKMFLMKNFTKHFFHRGGNEKTNK